MVFHAACPTVCRKHFFFSFEPCSFSKQSLNIPNPTLYNTWYFSHQAVIVFFFIFQMLFVSFGFAPSTGAGSRLQPGAGVETGGKGG